MHQRISSRNLQFDLMKGVACIAMIIAHARTIGVAIDTPQSVFFWQISLFAPVIFFFALGITMWHQVRSRGKRSVIASSLVLGLLSFADVGRTSAAYLTFGGIHLFGGLALSTLIALILPTQGSIFLGGMFAAVMADRVLGKLGIAPSIFSGQLFSVFPWVMYLLFGSIYRFDQKLFRTVAVGIGLVTGLYLLQSHYTLITQDASKGYVLLGLSVSSLVLWLCGQISHTNTIARFVAWIGTHSLVFYWVHLTILYAIPGRHTASIVWGGTLVATGLVILILEQIKQRSPPVVSSPVILGLVLLMIPLPAWLHVFASLRTLWCTGILIFLALYLKEVSALVARGVNWLSKQVANAPHPSPHS